MNESTSAGEGTDQGGEAPCLLPVFEREVVTVDLTVVAAEAASDAGSGAGGAVWSLPHDGDLDANLVVLHAGGSIGAHVNREVDVLMVVRRGTVTLTVDDEAIALRAGSLALVPQSRSRAIVAGDDGVEYLSIHRRRDGLRIS